MTAEKYLKSLITRTLLSLIMFFAMSIILSNDNHFLKINDILFSSNIDFSYFKSKIDILFGNFFNINTSTYVSSNKINYKNIENFRNGYKITTDYNYVINSLTSGTVIYIGNKDYYGRTIIIEGDDGINYWYSHIENISINLYDYVSSSNVIGSVIDNYFILTLEKEGKYLSYEDYL